jgi:holin-like protein
VFVYLSGLSNVAIGLLVLLSRYRVEPDAVLTVSLLGAGTILFGLLSLALASGLSRGSRLARLLVTAYLTVQAALQVVTILTTDPWDLVALVLLAVEVFIVVALWTPPGSRWFRAIAEAEASVVPPPA